MTEPVRVIKGGSATDDRGSLRFVNDFDFSGVKRFYQVQNHRQGFIRAWHGHLKEGKYVYVSSGAILLGAVPLVPEGNAYNIFTNDVQKFVVSAQSPSVIFIPQGYANGFKNLTDNTSVLFFSTSTLDESKGDDIRFPYDNVNIWNEDFR